jgi:hypothetical protein
VLAAEYTNAQAQLGQALLPAMLRLVEVGQQAIGTYNDLSPAGQNAVLAFGGLLAVAGPLTSAIGGVTSAVGLGIGAYNKAKGAIEAFRLQQHLARLEGLTLGQSLLTRLTPAVGAAGLALAAGVTAIGLWAKAKRDAKRATDEYIRSLESDNWIIGENTRLQAVNNLEQRGALELAEELGVSTETLTDAVLGEVEAREELDRAIAASQYADSLQGGARAAENAHSAANRLNEILAEETTTLANASEAAERKRTALGELPAAADQATEAIGEVGDEADAAKQQIQDTKTALD